MPAELSARLDGDTPAVDLTGESRDHVTLLAAVAERIAEQEGSRPQAVLARAQSRSTRTVGRAD